MYSCYSAAANERSSHSQFVTHLLIKEEHISYEPKRQLSARDEIVPADLTCYKVDRTECLPE